VKSWDLLSSAYTGVVVSTSKRRAIEPIMAFRLQSCHRALCIVKPHYRESSVHRSVDSYLTISIPTELNAAMFE
jgi:hypothetical protein